MKKRGGWIIWLGLFAFLGFLVWNASRLGWIDPRTTLTSGGAGLVDSVMGYGRTLACSWGGC